MGGKEETKGCSDGNCSCGGCGSDTSPKIIPLASLLDEKKESYPQGKTCAGCGAGKT